MTDQYANVTVSHRMHGDRRFALLAELGGWTVGDASWRMVQLWARCTALQTDRPPAVEIRVHLGLRGEQHLLDAALGERQPDGSIRVLGGGLTGGDTDRFGWYEPVREQQREAGLKRAQTAVRGAGGRFGGRSSAGPAGTSGSATAGPATASGSPAGTSGPPASGFRIPDLGDQNSLSACARPPEPGPEPASPAQSFAAKDLARHRALGDLAEAIWTRLSTLRIQHAAKLGLEGTLPFPPITPGSVPRAFDELRARLREEGDNARATADRVLRVLDEQAQRNRSIEWLSEKAFLSGPWSKARETVLAKRKPPAATPATPPVFMASDDDRAAAAAELAAFLGKSAPPTTDPQPQPAKAEA